MKTTGRKFKYKYKFNIFDSAFPLIIIVLSMLICCIIYVNTDAKDLVRTITVVVLYVECIVSFIGIIVSTFKDYRH